MSYQNISYSLQQTDIDAIKAALQGINTTLPFLITLGVEERKALFKLGPKSADFVQDASTAAANFPNILPVSFDRVEYDKDTTLFKALADIKFMVDSLQEKLDNTYMAVGSEAMIASLEVYAYVQTAADRTPGLKTVAEKLKDRFRAQGARKKPGDSAQSVK
jgi:hypothetical protein